MSFTISFPATLVIALFPRLFIKGQLFQLLHMPLAFKFEALRLMFGMQVLFILQPLALFPGLVDLIMFTMMVDMPVVVMVPVLVI